MNNFVQAIPLAGVDSATFVNMDILPFFPTGLPQACSIVRIVNDSQIAVGISFDGLVVHDVLAAGGTIQLDFQTNSSPNNKSAKMAKGSNIGANDLLGAGGGVGFIYLIGYYQE